MECSDIQEGKNFTKYLQKKAVKRIIQDSIHLTKYSTGLTFRPFTKQYLQATHWRSHSSRTQIVYCNKNILRLSAEQTLQLTNHIDHTFQLFRREEENESKRYVEYRVRSEKIIGSTLTCRPLSPLPLSSKLVRSYTTKKCSNDSTSWRSMRLPYLKQPLRVSTKGSIYRHKLQHFTLLSFS